MGMLSVRRNLPIRVMVGLGLKLDQVNLPLVRAMDQVNLPFAERISYN